MIELLEVHSVARRAHHRVKGEFRQVFKSITADNGSEFLDGKGLQKAARCDEVYYAHPFSSWELNIFLLSYCVHVYTYYDKYIERRDTMRDRDLLRLLLRNGWKEVHVRRSYHKLRKGTQSEIILVHGKDVPTGLLNSIRKRMELK